VICRMSKFWSDPCNGKATRAIVVSKVFCLSEMKEQYDCRKTGRADEVSRELRDVRVSN
jgi:hypothetical protein